MRNQLNNVAVFYHKEDNDGVMSGVIAKHFLTPRADGVVHLVPANYGDDFEALAPNPLDFYEDILVVDLSDDKLFEKWGHKVTWVDHHKTAIAKKPKVRDSFCIDGVAACRLLFDYLTSVDYPFHDKKYFVDRANPLEPLVVTLLGECDIWDHRSPCAVPLNFGQVVNFDKVNMLFHQTKGILVGDDGVFSSNGPELDAKYIKANKLKSDAPQDFAYLDYILSLGEGVFQFVKETKNRIRPHYFTAKVNGEPLRGVSLNTHVKSSFIWDLGEDEDFMMVWSHDANIIKVSFYSDKYDVSKIAKHFKGGGHEGAAGCPMTFLQVCDILTNGFDIQA